MVRRIKDYIKYTLIELENYTKQNGSCIKKINKTFHINFPPYGLGSFKSTLLKIISEKKIGSYDPELNGIILDVRNIKVIGNTGSIRDDDPTMHINIKGDFYVFQPNIGSIVQGMVKHKSSKQIGVIIYRVFSVPIKLADWYDTSSIELNSSIEFRIKDFDLLNIMPYIEGELVAKEMPMGNQIKHTNLNSYASNSDSSNTDDDDSDEDKKHIFKKPKTPKFKTASQIVQETENDEIVFSEVFHLNTNEAKDILKRKVKKQPKSEPSSSDESDASSEVEDKKPIIQTNTNSKYSKQNSSTTSLKQEIKKDESDTSDDSDSMDKFDENAAFTSTQKNIKLEKSAVNHFQSDDEKTIPSSSQEVNMGLKTENITPIKKIKMNTPNSKESGSIKPKSTPIYNGYESEDLFENCQIQDSQFVLPLNQKAFLSSTQKPNDGNVSILCSDEDNRRISQKLKRKLSLNNSISEISQRVMENKSAEPKSKKKQTNQSNVISSTSENENNEVFRNTLDEIKIEYSDYSCNENNKPSKKSKKTKIVTSPNSALPQVKSETNSDSGTESMQYPTHETSKELKKSRKRKFSDSINEIFSQIKAEKSFSSVNESFKTSHSTKKSKKHKLDDSIKKTADTSKKPRNRKISDSMTDILSRIKAEKEEGSANESSGSSKKKSRNRKISDSMTDILSRIKAEKEEGSANLSSGSSKKKSRNRKISDSMTDILTKIKKEKEDSWCRTQE